ncbi:MAG: c-type cytochrome [Planctomycetes bacterium]|nr:c-type cytochrome [Planctomycetota bacterium]
MRVECLQRDTSSNRRYAQDFVRAACANELGLEVPGHPQPRNPLIRPPAGTAGKQVEDESRFDLHERDCEALLAYVAVLPTPTRATPGDVADMEAAAAGEQVFGEIGCTACHLPNVGSIEGIYSDLLVHDMGMALSDPHIVQTEPERPRESSPRRGYSGGVHLLTEAEAAARAAELEREWRTPPLWGCADSAPYLHDGRAGTLDEAIRLHDGEAAPAALAYRRLDERNQQRLIAFLKTLVAPR